MSKVRIKPDAEVGAGKVADLVLKTKEGGVVVKLGGEEMFLFPNEFEPVPQEQEFLLVPGNGPPVRGRFTFTTELKKGPAHDKLDQFVHPEPQEPPPMIPPFRRSMRSVVCPLYPDCSGRLFPKSDIDSWACSDCQCVWSSQELIEMEGERR